MSLPQCNFWRGVDRGIEQLVLNRIQAENFPNASEASSMDRQGAEFFQCAAVLWCGIALMRRKAIASVCPIQIEHVSVACGLCNY